MFKVSPPPAPVSCPLDLKASDAHILWQAAGRAVGTGTARAKSTGPDIRVITRARNRLAELMCR